MGKFFVGRMRSGGRAVSFKDEPPSGSLFEGKTRQKALNPGAYRGLEWTFTVSFPDMERALDCALAMRDELNKLGMNHNEFVIFEVATVIWKEYTGTLVGTPYSPSPQEETMHCDDVTDIKAPLTIPRTDLISALQVHLDEEVAKREAIQAEKAGNRSKIAAAIAKFSSDELVNFFAEKIGAVSAIEFEQWVERVQEDKRYVSADQLPNYHETELEKYVRVLTLANNDVIEVTPYDPIYPLL